MARAKGTAKTGGREKGTPNKATADIKALAQLHASAVMDRLVHLYQHAESEQVQLAACREILDRAYGKAPQAIVGKDGGPIRSTFTFRIQRPNAMRFGAPVTVEADAPN